MSAREPEWFILVNLKVLVLIIICELFLNYFPIICWSLIRALNYKLIICYTFGDFHKKNMLIIIFVYCRSMQDYSTILFWYFIIIQCLFLKKKWSFIICKFSDNCNCFSYYNDHMMLSELQIITWIPNWQQLGMTKRLKACCVLKLLLHKSLEEHHQRQPLGLPARSQVDFLLNK